MTRDEYTELVGLLGGRFDRIDDRLDRFRVEVRDEFACVRQEVKWGFEGVNTRIDRVESDVTQLRAARLR